MGLLRAGLMQARRVAAVLLALSLASWLAAFANSAFLFGHWLLSLGALCSLWVPRERRRAALAGVLTLAALLALGLLGAGIAIRRTGTSGTSDSDISAAAMGLALSSAVAGVCVYAVIGSTLLPRLLGTGALTLLTITIVGILLGLPEKVLTLSVMPGAALGVATIVALLPELMRVHPSAGPA